MRRIDAWRTAAALLCVGLMPACSSGGPSDDEAEAALLVQVRHNFGNSAVFESFELEGCTGEKDLYRCKLRGVLAYTLTFGTVSEEKRQPLVGHYTFMRTDEGWQFVN